MPRQADWDRPAEELFFRPGLDRGLWLLDPVRDWWRVVPRGRIAGASISRTPSHHDRIDEQITAHHARRQFGQAIETATQPVVVEKLDAQMGSIALGGRWLLTGASGTRLRNAHVWARGETHKTDEEVGEAMAKLRHRDPYPPALWPGDIAGLDLVLDARNGFAYFHVLTETLANLAYADRPDFTGRIVIQIGSKRDVAGFVMGWIEALWPHLADRVTLTSKRVRADRALTVLNARHLHAQTGAKTMPSLGALGPDSHFWQGRDADRTSLAVLAMNGYEEGLRRLRDVALRRIAGGDWSHLPKRFWLGRKAERARDMAGEGPLRAALRERGFAEIYFEDLTPLEQVAIMSRAEIMVGYHGAGFANMVFAGPQAHVVELGHLQTCLYRWQDFMPHATVSRCRYTSLFADLQVDGGRADHAIRPSPLVPVALEDQAPVLDYIDALRGAPRVVADLDWLRRMADLLVRLEDVASLRALLSVNRKAALNDPDLTIHLANQAVEDGEDRVAVGLLEKAWLATGDRPFLLERLIVLGAQAGVQNSWDAEHKRLYPHRADRLARRLGRMRASGAA